MLKSNDTAVVGLGEESKVHEVETSRIVSSEASHYILVKGMDIESQSSQDEGEEENNDSQTSKTSQTSSSDPDMGGRSICMGSGSFPGSIPNSRDVDVEPSIDDVDDGGGACPTASSREEIEHEVRKFFRDRKESLEAESRNKSTMIGSEIKCAAASAGDKTDTIVLESESASISGEKKVEQAQKSGNDQKVVVIQEGTSELASKEDNDPQSMINLPLSAAEAEDENKHSILSCDTKVKEEKTEGASSSSVISIDLTAVHTTQEEPKSLQVSPPKQTKAQSMECDLLRSSENSETTVADVHLGLIESDDRGSPSPLSAAAAEVELIESDSPAAAEAEIELIESDDGGSPSSSQWSGGKEVEALLTVAPPEAQKQLSLEVEQLERERTRQSRAAASVSNQMYKESQVCMCTMDWS